MSTIKHNQAPSHSHSSHKSHATAPKASAPKAEKHDHKEAKPAEKKDGFSASKELDEHKKPKDAKDAKEAKDGQKPGDDKDAKKAEDKDKDKDALTQKLSDLQKQLDDMKNNKPEEPENLGGCCGKSHDSKKSDDAAQKDDPDSELTKLAVAVMSGGKVQQPQPGGKPGEKGAQPISGNPAELKAQLSQKYQEYKTQGVPLRKETEQLVESALNGGTSATNKPGDPKKSDATNKSNTNHNQPRPLAKAS